MQKLKLENGSEMPQFGLGTWRAPDSEEIKSAITTALEVGYRHLDCSPLYGNEKAIGESLQSAYNEGLVKRDALWITSKLWNTEHKKEDVFPALEKTLNDLQTDYLDLYLIHWPIALKRKGEFEKESDQFYTQNERPLAEAWKKLIEAKEKGLVKNIGVSNHNSERIQHLIKETGVKPAVNQIENHAKLQQPKLIDFCNKNNIVTTAYCPLATGFPKVESLLKDETVNQLAVNENCTAAQLLIAYQLSRGLIVIPKSTNAGRIKQNYDAQFINLTEETKQTLAKMDEQKRCIEANFWTNETSPYDVNWLWES